RGSRPIDFSRLKISRQEIPASTRIRALELSTRAAFPRLPLASTETETPMCLEHTFKYYGYGSNCLVKSAPLRIEPLNQRIETLNGSYLVSISFLNDSRIR